MERADGRACTFFASTPTDPSFGGWNALGSEGDLSPHSWTGVIASSSRWHIADMPTKN